ncbi:MAG: flagellar FlbD family protein [Syntrophomonas sp.]|nr:flagellar FlbD family protein [Syntrophomonas sp.]
MIYLTRLNGIKFMLNIDLIETVEETPDTVITLTTGKKILVQESCRDIQNEIVEFRKIIYCNLKK